MKTLFGKKNIFFAGAWLTLSGALYLLVSALYAYSAIDPFITSFLMGKITGIIVFGSLLLIASAVLFHNYHKISSRI
ncbi:hypothetical protein FUAX_34730 [Fulvitalea axinellae]|uniref:Uncharacterized protein n=1 Tax=Fulvitalea axinellae TaxID=1182444 RepID=A0AAU9CPI4_9BACT|nr:hypothetical protein FUAX_34730 [Fulvitalea axinellae]